MTTTRMNSCGRSTSVLAARKRRKYSQVDFYNEAACARAINAGETRALILHPTKGHRWANTDRPPRFTGLFDWLQRCFGRVKAVKLAATLFRPAMMNHILRRVR